MLKNLYHSQKPLVRTYPKIYNLSWFPTVFMEIFLLNMRPVLRNSLYKTNRAEEE